ncbi:MAG: hypothetical protein DRG78_24870 [Epsilonproteobacteria bacterium]|nr:MAG: hypothetical protein DRG78_24870 [Campylobacterota bacterium]
MYWLSKNSRRSYKEYGMKYLIAKNLDDALTLREENPNFTLLFGASDIALKMKNNQVSGVVDLTHLDELSYIRKNENSIKIGALTTINAILQNRDITQFIPILSEASKEFASHQIRNIASLAGNVANASPVADMIAPLLVLNAKVTLLSSKGERTIFLSDLIIGFKSLDLNNEIITSFEIEIQKRQHYYRKVGPRAKLNIAKLSLAMVKQDERYFISGASLNPYVKRFTNLEELLNGKNYSDVDIKEAMDKDISPSGSFRSTKEYRRKVLFNMLGEALGKFAI